jgi:hypothetical protein
MIRRLTARAEIVIIIVLACIPVFLRLPYRVNIFLSWEGAYRMSKGQLPFRDFGTPLGGFYWVIPAIFFKIFGHGMASLVKAQVLLNILSGLSFLSILSSLRVSKGLRLASVVLFCISYSFFNFWPWYNHSVIVYELAGLACICRYAAASGLFGEVTPVWAGGRGWLAGGALLLVFSLLTKQDAGAMAFFVACTLLALQGLLQRTWKPLVVFCGSYIVICCLFILPFLRYGFGYWFNHGQAPHSARVSLFDIVDELFGASAWIKFYIFLIVVLVMARYRSWSSFVSDRRMVYLLVLTACILGEAAVFQVTSYTPPDNNIFFHSFAFPCIFALIGGWLSPGIFNQRRYVLVLSAGILMWWSADWWKYTQRIVDRVLPHAQQNQPVGGENVVNKYTFMISQDTVKEIPMDKWVECGLPSFAGIYMPPPTAAGIQRLMAMNLVRNGGGHLQVLNMSELTPLEADMPFQPEKNGRLPLWYHLGVGMFNRQADTLEARLRQHHYDLVLFEYLPTLNNFYPFRVRDTLRLHYRQVDSFLAPRRGAETRGMIEVYVRPGPADSLTLGMIR